MSKIESEADSRLEARVRRVVVGTVPYLNVQPLIWALETGRVEADAFGGHPFEIVPAHPRELAGRLRAGEFDVAIVPVFEYFLTPGYRIVPMGALATQREVGSVTVFSDAPLEEVSRIYLDPSSLTSVNLLRVLAAERGLRAEMFENPRAVSTGGASGARRGAPADRRPGDSIHRPPQVRIRPGADVARHDRVAIRVRGVAWPSALRGVAAGTDAGQVASDRRGKPRPHRR